MGGASWLAKQPAVSYFATAYAHPRMHNLPKAACLAAKGLLARQILGNEYSNLGAIFQAIFAVPSQRPPQAKAWCL